MNVSDLNEEKKAKLDEMIERVTREIDPQSAEVLDAIVSCNILRRASLDYLTTVLNVTQNCTSIDHGKFTLAVIDILKRMEEAIMFKEEHNDLNDMNPQTTNPLADLQNIFEKSLQEMQRRAEQPTEDRHPSGMDVK